MPTSREHSEFLAIPAFKARFRPSQTLNSNSVNGTMFSSFPAFQRCKVRPCAIDIQSADLPGTFRLDARFLYSQMLYSKSVNGTMFSSFPAFQWCKIPPCAIDNQ